MEDGKQPFAGAGNSGDDEIGRGSNFIQTAERRFRRARNASSEWREQAKTYYSAYGGDPWPDGAKEAMEEDGRPVANFNYSLSQVNAVLGQDIADRKEARFEGIGAEPSDQFGGEVFTALIRSLYLKCRGHREETEAFQDQLVTGYGWCESYLDTHRFPIWPKLAAVDCQEMYPDPDAKKNNLADAKYLFRKKWWSLEDAQAKWPGKKAALRRISSTNSTSSGVFPKQANFDGFKTKGSGVPDPQLREDGLYIYDYQFKKLEKWVIFRDPRDGERRRLPKKEFEAEKEIIFQTIDPSTQEVDPMTQQPTGGIPYARLDSAELDLEMVYRSFLAGGDQGGFVEVEKQARLETEMFTYRCATGYRSKQKDGTIRFFGLMSIIYEPQLWTAKAMSSMIEHIARSPKGSGGFVVGEMLEDSADFLANGSKMGKWNLVKAGFEPGKHMTQVSTPPLPQSYERFFEIAETAMGRLTTVSDSFKGTLTSERSNVLITNLQGQTMMVLNPLIDPMSQMRVENAQLMAKLAQLHLAPEDFNRLVGHMEAINVTYVVAKDPMTGAEIWQGGEPVKEPIPIPDPTTGQPMTDEMGQPIPTTPFDVCSSREIFEFDVTVDLGPASVTAKQAIWQNMTQTALAMKLFEMYPEVGKELMPWLFKNLPGLSTDEAQKIEKKLRSILRQTEMQGTVQGIMESLQTLPPEAIQQVNQVSSQMLQQTQQQQMAPPQQGEQPVQ